MSRNWSSLLAPPLVLSLLLLAASGLRAEDELSDAPVREFAAELVRETCFEELGQEVPYAVAVQVEDFKDRGPDLPIYIETVLYVEKESQKGIVIGAGGKMIRRIGSTSSSKTREQTRSADTSSRCSAGSRASATSFASDPTSCASRRCRARS